MLSSLRNYDYNSAKTIVNGEKFYNKEKDIFLNKVEKGTTYYLSKDYYQSLKYFEEAQKICENLSATTRVSGKLKGVIDPAADNYYCEKYERSLLNFYLSLINYNLYSNGRYEPYTRQEKDKIVDVSEKILNQSEKLAHLSASRSYIIKWNSLLSTYKKELAGKSGYKDDLVAKLWGAYIHEQFDNSENRQIALQLYKDAKDVLVKNYSVYPTFNKKNESFEKNYKKFNNNNIDKIKKDYIENTEFSNNLLAFLDEKIKDLSSNKRDNFTVVLKEDFVSEKKGEVVKVGLPLEFVAAVEFQPTNNRKGLKDFIFSALAVDGADVLPGIEIELPYVEKKPVENNFVVEVLNKNNSKATEFPVVLLNPNSDIAKKEFEDKRTLLYTQMSVLAITKHTSALIAAYQIYAQNPNGLTFTAALTSYKTAAKLINETTKADLRYWASLSDNVRIGSAKLNAGEYLINVYDLKKNGVKTKVKSEIIKIDEKNNTLLDINVSRK